MCREREFHECCRIQSVLITIRIERSISLESLDAQRSSPKYSETYCVVEIELRLHESCQDETDKPKVDMIDQLSKDNTKSPPLIKKQDNGSQHHCHET